MDLLRKEDGTTIIETLVGITILGIVVTLSFSLLLNLYGNRNLMMKQEAFQLADQEITNSLNRKVTTDTSYTSRSGSLMIERTVDKEKMIYTINVKVLSIHSAQEIISLSALYTN